MKHTRRWMRLTALFLALTLLLAGCATPAGGENPSETGTPSETAGTASEAGTLAETNEIIPSDDPSGDTVTPQDEMDETPVSSEDADLLERMGFEEGELVEVSDEEVAAIDRAVAGMQAAYVAGPNGEDPLVKSRDWSIYTSSLGQENLSKREAEFYSRLDKMCLKYLSTSGLDGVKTRCSNGKSYYTTRSVKFSDLGLSKSQAYAVYHWFLYNHPQYYFLYSTLADSSSLYPRMYEIMVDAEERAEITNELFDKLDGWIQEVEDSSSTTYQKELLVNNLLCIENNYEEQFEKPPEGGMRLDQSLYSSVLLGKTVCAGYAKAFCAMMNALGVDATAALSNNHAWNVVRLEDGNCYAVDVCWNDTDRYIPYENNYLNIGEEIMYATNSRKEAHTYRDNVSKWIPAIAGENYNLTDEEYQWLPIPRNFRATQITSTGVTLAWDEAPGIQEYEIILLFKDAGRSIPWYRRYASSNTWTFGPDLLEPDTSYEFSVRSRSRDYPAIYSDWTYVSVTTATDDSSAIQIAAPINVKATLTEDGRILMTWDPVLGAEVYDTCEYTDAAYTKIVEDSIYGYPADEGEYVYWTDLKAGKTYYWGVRARKEVNGETVYSDWTPISVTVADDGKSPPAAPTNVKVAPSETEKGKALLTWDPVPGATVYSVCAYADATYTTVREGVTAEKSADAGSYFSLNNAVEGNTYYLGLRAGKEVNGETVWSDWVNLSYTHTESTAP